MTNTFGISAPSQRTLETNRFFGVSSATVSLQPGDRVERYQLISLLGQGGQGQVFRARDTSSGHDVALKLIPLDTSSENAAERLRREARRLARLAHPSLPACYSLFEDLRLGLLGMAMEYIDGASLLDASRQITPNERVACLWQVAGALAYLHANGLVHRDLSPRNIMLSKDFRADPWRPGAVKLIDLGLSIEEGNARPLTALGWVVGTAPYISPERLFSRPGATPPSAADVFALGVIGWEIQFGCHPTGLPLNSNSTTFAQAYRDAAAWNPWPAVVQGDRLENVLRMLLALDPAQRPADGTMAQALLSSIPRDLHRMAPRDAIEPQRNLARPLPHPAIHPPRESWFSLSMLLRGATLLVAGAVVGFLARLVLSS